MKRTLALILAALLCLSLCACGKDKKADRSEYIGTWQLKYYVIDREQKEPDEHGDLTLSLNFDGSLKQSTWSNTDSGWTENVEEGSWEVTEKGFSVTLDYGTFFYTPYEDELMAMHYNDGGLLVIEKED